jgi:hypothetical protein
MIKDEIFHKSQIVKQFLFYVTSHINETLPDVELYTSRPLSAVFVALVPGPI